MNLQVIDITSYKHFLELTKKFDLTFKTQTYVVYMSLKDLNSYFAKVDVHKQFNRLVTRLFENKSQVYSNESWLNDSHIGKLNALAKIIQDIRTGVGIISPISLTYYQNNNSAIHPGSTRILLSEVYTKKVPVVITDYSNNFANKFQNLKIFSPENAMIENINKMRFAVDHTELADSPKAHREACPYPMYIKELTDHCAFYAKPTSANPPVLYQIKDKKLYVDNNCIAKYSKKRWSLFI